MTEQSRDGDRAIRMTSKNQPPVIRFTGRARLTVGGVVDAVTEAVETSGVTTADLSALHAVLRQAIADGVSDVVAAQRVEEQAPMFGALGRFLKANQGLLALVALVVTVIALLNDVSSADDQAESTPQVSVPVERPDPDEIERIVEERMREREDGPSAPTPQN